MPIYDVYCKKCGHEEIDVYMKVDDENPRCPHCNILMFRCANTKSFKLKYNPKTDIVDWDGNRTRYWDDYNKMKSEGKKPRIPALDGE
jgi:putative FmdB family regulatory protein